MRSRIDNHRSVIFDAISMSEYCGYELRSLRTPYITNIGAYDRQRSYDLTDFCAFDRYLFGGWTNKERLNFGNALENDEWHKIV